VFLPFSGQQIIVIKTNKNHFLILTNLRYLAEYFVAINSLGTTAQLKILVKRIAYAATVW